VLFLLFLAAAAGGGLNAVAGGGSFICLPALIWAGVPAVSANVTTTLAMWPGSISSAVAYRSDIGQVDRPLITLSVVCLVGGMLGGYLLVRTSDTGFLRLLPWLMLVAAATFTFSGPLTAWIRDRAPRLDGPVRHRPLPWWALALQLVIATYGGYFGGGIGIMMLAGFAMAGLTDIHEMNGLKAVLAVFINGVALVEFIVHGVIAWTPGLVMVAGAIVGGYGGASLARRIRQRLVRQFIVAVGWSMTIYFFLVG
jgi:uncharacterized membrane protein YfcA